MEAFEQGPRAGIGLGVERLVGMPVAPEESGQPKHVGMVRPADDHRSAGAGLEEPDAAEDERAHDALPELGFRHQHLAQLG